MISYCNKYVVFIFLFIITAIGVEAQQKVFIKGETLHMVVLDVEDSLPIETVTVSLLMKSDSNFIKYQLSTRHGEVKFDKLKLLKFNDYILLTSRVGYGEEEILVDQDSSRWSGSDTIFLRRKRDRLEEVIIKHTPPVKFNGDTLEFNPNAFKMDENAVLEDFFRKLNGIKIWGDGKITVNGKVVKTLLVNGKVFFDTDFTIALQNIPKSAVEKVQVYSTVSNGLTFNDSTTTVNVKLKPENASGLFGKIGVGLGSGGRYQIDQSINFYNNHITLSGVNNINNINVENLSIADVLRNGTFKGFSAINNYWSDFRQAGERKNSIIGAKLASEKSQKKELVPVKRSFDAEINLRSSQLNHLSNMETINFINPVDENVISTKDKDFSEEKNYSFYNSFSDVKVRSTLNASIHAGVQNFDKTKETTRINILNGDTTSIGSNQIKLNTEKKFIDFNYEFGFSPKKTLGLSYLFRFTTYISDFKEDRSSRLKFQSIDSIFSNTIDRSYGQYKSYRNGVFDFKLSGIENKLKIRKANRWPILFRNRVALVNERDRQLVTDYIDSIGVFEPNRSLTYSSRFQSLDNTVSIQLTRRFSKFFFNRFDRRLDFSFLAKSRQFYQANHSSISFQNIKNQYVNFIPSMEIQHSYRKYNHHHQDVKLEYFSSVQYPTIEQLVPLVDSIQIYYLVIGNRNLNLSRKNSIGFSWNKFMESKGNNDRYMFSVVHHRTISSFTTNETIDELGRIRVNILNGDYESRLEVHSEAEMGFTWRNTVNLLTIKGGFYHTDRPQYFNDVYERVKLLNGSGRLSLLTTFSNKIQWSLMYEYFYHQLERANIGVRLSNVHRIQTSLDINLTKRLSLNYNMMYNVYRTNSNFNDDFLILNCAISYRMLKNNALELKAAVLDLLNNNRIVRNDFSHNSFQSGFSNSLRQYGIISVSYFPRKF